MPADLELPDPKRPFLPTPDIQNLSRCSCNNDDDIPRKEVTGFNLVLLALERFVKLTVMMFGVALGVKGTLRATVNGNEMNAILAFLSTLCPLYLTSAYIYTKIRSLKNWNALTIRVHIYTHVFLAFFAIFSASCTVLICIMLELNGLDSSDYWEATFWMVHAFFWETITWITLRKYIIQLCSKKIRLCRVETIDSELSTEIEHLTQDADLNV
ncbi:unnamed protein product [Bursaphelenchus xylophilus]|uniref:(pine wood nematode) hypothetical protein n=1 Tax=Bursaphelenchus xylophilus TaxID=6326 RepID=A0A7I8X027_BURXY|nr:unnamed protein product [Bursaphelenchus xylophilus]CAG9129745.1 unnamed protein product [Bursaphelenchus xylophilus]